MKFPKRNIDISEYQSEIKALLGDNDCAEKSFLFGRKIQSKSDIRSVIYRRHF